MFLFEILKIQFLADVAKGATFDVIGYNKKTFDDCVSEVDNIESDVKMVIEHCNNNKNKNKNNNNK